MHSDADLTVMDEMKPYNQDAAVVPVSGWATWSAATARCRACSRPDGFVGGYSRIIPDITNTHWKGHSSCSLLLTPLSAPPQSQFSGLTVDSSPRLQPGQLLTMTDPWWGTSEFIYARANGTIRAFGQCVLTPVFDSSLNAYRWDATEVPNTANLGRMVCVSQVGLVVRQLRLVPDLWSDPGELHGQRRRRHDLWHRCRWSRWCQRRRQAD